MAFRFSSAAETLTRSAADPITEAYNARTPRSARTAKVMRLVLNCSTPMTAADLAEIEQRFDAAMADVARIA